MVRIATTSRRPKMRLLLLALASLTVLGLSAVGPAAPLPKGDGAGFMDSFDGKFALNWKVIRPDKDHVSLKKVPGSLVITTQRGSIHGKQANDALSEGMLAKNIHLIDIPFGKETDWTATTCISNFLPETTYQQAGLIVYEDDDNYLKWDYEYDWQRQAGQTFILVAETEGAPVHERPTETESGLKKFWLRLTKRADKYEYAWSKDGDKWVVGGDRTWGDGHPKRVGLIAKNGGNKDAPEIDAAFEFFELRPVASTKK
jgi:regulation of enolase protein 1 (concanavalin A-like superfamily)